MEKAKSPSSEQNGSFPMLKRVSGYSSRLLSCRVTQEEAEQFHALLDGLHAADARLPDGKHVDNASDVLRYLINYAFEHSVEVR